MNNELKELSKKDPKEPATFSSSPIWMMGRAYSLEEYNKEHLQDFYDDFSSIIWFTYRSHFPPLGNTLLTTDMGWGCMIRTGQMMLARALSVNFLGKGNFHFST